MKSPARLANFSRGSLPRCESRYRQFYAARDKRIVIGCDIARAAPRIKLRSLADNARDVLIEL